MNALLRTTLPRDWDSPLGRIEVSQIRPNTQGTGFWVLLANTGFPVDPDGYYFVNPPIQVYRGTMKHRAEDEAFRSVVTDAAVHYAGHPEVWGRTTTTVFSTTADGGVESSSATYSLARSGNALVVNTTDTNFGYQGQTLAGIYFCREMFYDFDTSSIADTDTIDSAVHSLYGHLNESTTDFIDECRLFDWGGTLTTADWVAGASLSGLTLLATFNTSGGWSTSGYNDFTSDPNFVANINKTGFTYVMNSSNRHRLGTPDPTGAERVSAYNADDAGTTRDPKLVVNSSAGGQVVVDPMGMTGFFGA